MCGRFTHMMTWTELVRLATLSTPDMPDLPLFPSFNVAPTQEVIIVRVGSAGPELAIARWGLVPHWADDPSVGAHMINARAETVTSKPAFREAFQQRRCLVPANGFFEWKTPPQKGKKQPYYIRLRNDQPFAFAGLWERWDKGDEALETCTIITCGPNELVAELHDRMPVILAPGECRRWLTASDPAELEAMLDPYPADEMVAYPVSTMVNNTASNDIACIQPLTDAGAESDQSRSTNPSQPKQKAFGFID
jgi:putative SOS response-associated peptidase YedK